jgi:4-amino-4-deoxy-L-arabinose transferase-like glycosyltransferase
VGAAENPAEEVCSVASERSPFGRWEGAASCGFVVLVAIALAWYTWARWGDIQVDCGRELYVPSEILRGKLLYRDIWYQYGPLAPYVEALLLFVFGPSLNAFYIFGLAVAIGCALLLLDLGTMLEGRATGLTAALALLFVGFSPGVFSYAFPYSYGATIGLALSLICASFTLRHVFGRWRYSLIMAGIAASLALLCKPEFGVGCYLMLGFVLVAETARQGRMRPLLHGAAACVPGIALWVGIYGWFFWTLTPTYMMEANWVGMPGTSGKAYADHLYSHIGHRFVPREIAVQAMCAALSLMLWFLLAKASRGVRNAALAIMVAITVAHRFGALDFVTRKVMTTIAVFPVGMFFIGGGFVGYAIYELNQSEDRRRLADAAFGILALFAALRVIAGIKPLGYSIYYAMPLFLVFVIAISRCIKAATPQLSDDRQRRLVNYLLAAEAVMLAMICISPANQRPATLQTSWGDIHLEQEDASVAQQILAFISEQKHQGRRVAVLPEAPILYALTGTEAPSRWYNLLPGFVSPAQEDTYISDLNRASPDYILLTSRKTREYGANYFGIDYNQKIYYWIESNYRVAGQFGHFSRDRRGSRPLAALLYQRRDPPNSAARVSK